MPARRARGASRAKARTPRTQRQQRIAPQLSELAKWQAQRDKLVATIARVEAAPTMQGQAWKDGQLRYLRGLLANLDASRPSA